MSTSSSTSALGTATRVGAPDQRQTAQPGPGPHPGLGGRHAAQREIGRDGVGHGCQLVDAGDADFVQGGHVRSGCEQRNIMGGNEFHRAPRPPRAPATLRDPRRLGQRRLPGGRGDRHIAPVGDPRVVLGEQVGVQVVPDSQGSVVPVRVAARAAAADHRPACRTGGRQPEILQQPVQVGKRQQVGRMPPDLAVGRGPSRRAGRSPARRWRPGPDRGSDGRGSAPDGSRPDPAATDRDDRSDGRPAAPATRPQPDPGGRPVPWPWDRRSTGSAGSDGLGTGSTQVGEHPVAVLVQIRPALQQPRLGRAAGGRVEIRVEVQVHATATTSGDRRAEPHGGGGARLAISVRRHHRSG